MAKVLMTRQELDIVYVSSFYDIPLEGLCRYNGKIERFKVDDETEEVTIIHLTQTQRIKALIRKKLFEICVGTHYTYKDGKRLNYFHWRKPYFLHRFLFEVYYSVKKW